MEKEQKIYLDDFNKLVVVTNQGRIDGNESYAIIQGEFTIHANDVAKLLSMINEKNVKCYHDVYQYYSRYIVASNNTLINDIEKLNHELQEVKKDRDVYLRENEQLGRLIDNFNNSRYFWERKLNIEEWKKKKL